MSGPASPAPKLGLRQKLRQTLSSKSSTSSNISTLSHQSPTPNTGLQSSAGTGVSSSHQQQQLASPSVGQHLFTSAAQRLSVQERQTLRQYTNSSAIDVHDAIDQAIAAATDKRRTCLGERWTFTIAGRHVVLREEADKVVHWLNRFKAIGDVASNVDPFHVGLPWAGIRLLLEVAVTESNQMAALLAGCEAALFMASRLRVYTDFMHQLPVSLPRKNLEESISLLCTHILRFLARAIQVYQTPTIQRVASAIWKINEVVDFEKKGDGLVSNVERDANSCDRIVTAQDGQVLGQLQQNMQQALNDLQKFHQLQASLDRLHLKIDLDKIPYVKGAIFNSVDSVHTRCHPATRLDLLAQIQQWAQQPNGKNIFWLHGAAGIGKSTISWTIAQWLDDQSPLGNVDLGASFFFKRGDGDRGSASRFFPTILRQLVLKIPGLDVLITKAIEKDPFIFEKALGEQFRRLLLEPLQAVYLGSPGSPPLVVVIDALDECESDGDIETILQLWSQLFHATMTPIRLFLTSRPDLPIRLKFRQMSTDLFENINLQDAVPLNTIEQDLWIYLRDAFTNIRERAYARAFSEPALSEDWPGGDIIKILVDMAVPLFIVAATVCRFVGDLEFDPSERLNEILSYRSTGQMAQMEMTYLPVLKHLTASTRSSAERTKLCEEFRLVVGSIICLVEPLSIADLANLLNKTIPSIVRRLHPLHSVLHVSDDHLVPVRILHLSFAEFLFSENLANQPFGIDALSAHLVLTKHCLQLLSGSDGLRENICDLDSPARLRRDVDAVSIRTRLPSALQYACRYWVIHAQHSGMEITDEDEVHIFLRKHYLHWLEALSLMGRISDAIRLLDILQSRVSITASVQIASFLEDARRFTLANRYIADLSPLQLYSSATIFAPQTSLVRDMCGEIPKWIPQHPKTSGTWGPELQKLEGHTNIVHAVAFSHDDLLIASASEDHTVRLWNSITGQEIQKLEGHTSFVTSLAFSHDDSLLASASRDNTVCIWKLSTGQVVQRIKEYTGCLAFSHTTMLLALALDDYTIRLWNPIAGGEIRKLEGHTNHVDSMAFSSDGSLLASAALDGTVCLWSPSTGDMLQILGGHSRYRGAVAISYDGALLASTSDEEEVRLWNLIASPKRYELGGHKNSQNCPLAFAPDGSLLASVSEDSTVLLWNTSTGRMIHKLAGHSWTICSLMFSHDSSQLVTASYDQTVRLWSLSTDQDVRDPDGHTNMISDTMFSHDGSLLVSASNDGTVRLWDPSTGVEVQELEGHTGLVNDIKISDDDSLLAVASTDMIVEIWNLFTGQIVWRLKGHTESIYSVAFSHQGLLLATASMDGTVKVWSLSTGQELHDLKGYASLNIAVSFSHDDSLLALALVDMGTSNQVRLWNVSTGQEIRTIEREGEGGGGGEEEEEEEQKQNDLEFVYDIAFSHNSSLLGLALRSLFENVSMIELWNVSTGRVARKLHCSGNIDKLSFTLNDNGLLTNRGVVKIGTACLSETEFESDAYSSLYLEHDWVLYNGEKILWLPDEYRRHVAVHDDMIAFGTASGQISFMRIDPSRLPLKFSAAGIEHTRWGSIDGHKTR